MWIKKLINKFKKQPETVKPEIVKTNFLESLLSFNPVDNTVTSPVIGSSKYFDEYLTTMRQHQKEALERIEGHDVGQITIPTGTGKTRIQIALHVKEMLNLSSNNETGVFVIAAHRLTLCTQLLNDLIDVSLKSGLKFDIVYIGTDRYDDIDLIAKYANQGIDASQISTIATTNGFDIVNAYKRSHENKRHLIVVSTYHSFNRLKVLQNINLCTFDEAHISLGEDFTKNIEEVKDNIKRQYFFTATRKVINDDLGMNDTKFYGEILYSKSPRAMIEAGELCTPRIHNVKPIEQDEKYDNIAMLSLEIIKAYEQHRKALKKCAIEPEKIGAKLLVTFKGCSDMVRVYNEPIFKEWRRINNINVFNISSEHGCYHDNNENINRQEFMKRLNSLKDSDNALLFHVDILAEGIDLPSITGVFIFRNVEYSKFMQTIGRAARLTTVDRKKLYSGEIKPMEYQKMVKPFFHVLIAEGLFTNKTQYLQFKGYIHRLRQSYGIPYQELFQPELFLDEPTPDMDAITERDLGGVQDDVCDIEQIIEDIEIDEENTNIQRHINSLNIIKNMDERINVYESLLMNDLK